MDIAPIILFVYNRPWHTKETVEALRHNSLAVESDLHIFSDHAKDAKATEDVNMVREYIVQIEGFRNVIIHKRDRNWGLADNIINGVTKVAAEYGKVIVLEDDIKTSPCFLEFMNNALNFYKDIKKVWHIGGWNYPIANDGMQDTFLWRVMNCWGWATWADRWSSFEKDTDKLIKSFSRKDIKRFNLDGVIDYWDQVLANKAGRIDSWAIYWYATIFRNNGLCLSPVQTFVENIGHDGSGVHCGKRKKHIDQLNLNKRIRYEGTIAESKKYVSMIKKIERKSWYQKVKMIERIMRKKLYPKVKILLTRKQI